MDNYLADQWWPGADRWDTVHFNITWYLTGNHLVVAFAFPSRGSQPENHFFAFDRSVRFPPELEHADVVTLP